MTQLIRIIKGTYRNESMANKVFPLVKQYQSGAKGGFVTVDGSAFLGENKIKIRIKVSGPMAYQFLDAAEAAEVGVTRVEAEAEPVSTESDQEIMDRIEKRFNILTVMTKGCIAGDVRAMIVTGPPGVGKSFNVEAEMEKASLFDKISGKAARYEVVKGAMTAIGLYCKLFEFSDSGNILVFDDCDDVFNDEQSLNILKAALDSGKRRRICWNSDSSMLRRESVPDQFDFKGSVIFITNKNFENVKSKKMQDHLAALESRCHFLDLTMNTMRDKFLRIKQIARTGLLWSAYGFTDAEEAQILDFIDVNKLKLREMSLRMALKVADMFKMAKDIKADWQDLARETCMRPSAA